MKPLNLKRDSWHYKAADMAGWSSHKIIEVWSDEDNCWIYKEVKNDDFCAYCRRVLLGLFMYTLIIGIVGLIIGASLFVCVWSWYNLVMGVWAADFKIDWLGVIIGSAIQITCAYKLWCHLKPNQAQDFARGFKSVFKRNKTKKPVEPGFLRSAYKSFKDKTCSRVTFN